MLTTFWKKNKVYIILIAVALLAVGLSKLTAVARLLSFVNYLCTFVFGSLSSFVPFSLYGLLWVTAPILLIIVIVWFVRCRHKGYFLKNVLAIACVLTIIFYCVYGFGYAKKSVYEQYGLKVENSYTEGEITDALKYYSDKAALELDSLDTSSGNTSTKLSFNQVSQLITDSYNTIEGFDFLYSYNLKPKEFFPSFAMNYTGVVGLFFPIYAEINICVNVPEYSIPHTMAHEFAHSKGANNEGECNFIGCLVCFNSKDSFTRYSGYYYATLSLYGQLYRLDKTAAKTFAEGMDQRIKNDINYYYDFFEPFDGFINDVGDFLNDIFLKSNGVSEGTVSYSKSALGLTAYYLTNFAVVDKG